MQIAGLSLFDSSLSHEAPIDIILIFQILPNMKYAHVIALICFSLAVKSLAADASPTPTTTPSAAAIAYFDVDVNKTTGTIAVGAGSDVILHLVNADGTSEPLGDTFVSQSTAIMHSIPSLGVVEIVLKPDFTGHIVVIIGAKTKQKVIVLTLDVVSGQPA